MTKSEQKGQETKISKNVLTSTKKYGVEFQDHEIQLKVHLWANNRSFLMIPISHAQLLQTL